MTGEDRRHHVGQLSALRELRAEFDQQTFDRLVDAFSLDAFNSLNRLLQAPDGDQRAAAVHRLAGIVAQYGFRHVARLVEHYGSLPADSRECREATAPLRFEIYKAARSLRKIGARPTSPTPPLKTGL